MNDACREDNMISCIHERLNFIYSLSENVYKSLKNEMELKALYNYYNGHYIKINDKYEYQKYPVPVISIEGKGDIGFNIDGVWIEFFIDRETFYKANIEELINKYDVEIYGGNNCLIDFYSDGKSVEDLFSDIENSDEEIIGISIYLKDTKYNNIKDAFFEVCSLLNM